MNMKTLIFATLVAATLAFECYTCNNRPEVICNYFASDVMMRNCRRRGSCSLEHFRVCEKNNNESTQMNTISDGTFSVCV